MRVGSKRRSTASLGSTYSSRNVIVYAAHSTNTACPILRSTYLPTMVPPQPVSRGRGADVRRDPRHPALSAAVALKPCVEEVRAGVCVEGDIVHTGGGCGDLSEVEDRRCQRVLLDDEFLRL